MMNEKWVLKYVSRNDFMYLSIFFKHRFFKDSKNTTLYAASQSGAIVKDFFSRAPLRTVQHSWKEIELHYLYALRARIVIFLSYAMYSVLLSLGPFYGVEDWHCRLC